MSEKFMPPPPLLKKYPFGRDYVGGGAGAGTASSHYLNQGCLAIKMILCCLLRDKIFVSTQDFNPPYIIWYFQPRENLVICLHHTMFQQLLRRL